MAHSRVDSAAVSLPKEPGSLEGSMAGRVPSLDGLRAVSIIAVLLGHLSGTRGAPSLGFLSVLGDYANLGVRVFFVISGFLITSLLIAERKKTGRISIRQFFIRRVFRIFPAAYFYIAVIAVLGLAFGLVHVKPGEFLYAATYTTNYVPEKSWVLGHLWSLAVEEQFYVLWPLAMAVLSLSGALRLTLVVIALSPIVRLVWLYWLPEPDHLVGKAFPTIADAIATGCLLALARPALNASSGYRAFLSSMAFLLVPLAVLVSNALASHTRLDCLVGQSIRNFGIALVIDRCVRFPQRGIAVLLNTTAFVTIGQLSYSLYLWQQPFLNRNALSIATSFPVNLALTLVAAALSYSFVEKPFLRLRARLFP